jgi:hypothetical protein
MTPPGAALLSDAGVRWRGLSVVSMDFVSIALMIVGIWICGFVFVLAICKAAARADSDEERFLASRPEGAADARSRRDRV